MTIHFSLQVTERTNMFGMAPRGVVREPYAANVSAGPLFTPKLLNEKFTTKTMIFTGCFRQQVMTLFRSE